MQNSENFNNNSSSTTDKTAEKQKKQKTKLQLKAPTQERSRQTVLTILDACSKLLVKEGFFGVTTDKVAKEAGVSIGSLYQFFGNKESVVSAVIQDLSRRDLEAFKALMENLGSAPEKERAEKIVSAFFNIYSQSLDLRLKIQSLQNYLLDQKFHAQYMNAYAEMIEKWIPQRSGTNGSQSSYMIANTIIGFLNNTLESAKNFNSDADIQKEMTRMIQSYMG